MQRLLILAVMLAAAAGPAAAETAPEAPPGMAEGGQPRGFRDLAAILEERMSSLEAIRAIQGELLGLARHDPQAAWLARPAMARCRLALPELWCVRLDATFRAEGEGEGP